MNDEKIREMADSLVTSIANAKSEDVRQVIMCALEKTWDLGYDTGVSMGVHMGGGLI